MLILKTTNKKNKIKNYFVISSLVKPIHLTDGHIGSVLLPSPFKKIKINKNKIKK